MPCGYYDEQNRFTQPQYGRQPVFSSFLPGMAGPWGIPMWCNYNNRGQAVCSFGVRDKDHALMEFTAASTAYQRVGQTGFRTFVKRGGLVLEPFADGLGTMVVEQNVLRLQWEDGNIRVDVTYCTLTNEPMAGLCRKLEIRNLTQSAMALEVLDGMAAIVPYGVSDEKLKQEANLSTAWMQVEAPESDLPYFHVRASMEDSAKVTRVSGGNFRLAVDTEGNLLPAVVQPGPIFDWDTALGHPVAFAAQTLDALLKKPQLTGNYLPCCFTPWTGSLMPGAAMGIWELYGQAESMEEAAAFRKKAASFFWFEGKLEEAGSLTREITRLVHCHTADPVFDGYVAQNFLDNVMRGGLPCAFTDDPEAKPAYLYSRKHGDPEREYNFFSLGQEYFSQGNGNFRDICQNRRSDVMVMPSAGKFNMQLFFELLQLDGYNPLVVQPVTYRVAEPERYLTLVPPEHRGALERILSGGFSLGELGKAAREWDLEDVDTFLSAILQGSHMEPNAAYQEGYWSDHWTYLLDLLESELAVFPDREEALFFEEPVYRWFGRQATVRPQAQRYCLTEDGLRQYHCVERLEKDAPWETDRNGCPIRSNLAEKLLVLSLVKYATLDLSGAAIEMEGGKPGWYDALNGLPGLLGASVAEGCELLRLLEFLLDRLRDHPREVELLEEAEQLWHGLLELEQTRMSDFDRWICRNSLRDGYREALRRGLSGKRTGLTGEELLSGMNCLRQSLRDAILTVTEKNGGICPTYFYYEAAGVKKTRDGWMPEGLIQKKLPLFLEGPTRWLRTRQEHREAMAQAVRDSALWDEALRMYKVNTSLADVSYEVGRARAFPPGWLENESVWLHMAYKYFLAMLEGGMYRRFFREFRTAAPPFLPLEMYRRSTMENSSFLLSSVNGDVSSHGRGYVARLSGSTAEFISIWNQMLFGKKPFSMEEDGLHLALKPALPDYLLPLDAPLTATFLGRIKVEYRTGGLRELVPGEYRITGYCLTDRRGRKTAIQGDRIPPPWSQKIRSGEIGAIRIDFERNTGK